MTTPANFQRKFQLLRGSLYFREAGTEGAWTPFGPSRDSSLSLSIENVTLVSGDDGATLDTRQTAKNAEFATTLQSLSDSNLAIALQTPVVKAPAVVDGAVTIPVLVAGQAVFVQPGVTELTVTGLTEGVDYALDKEAGRIVALKDLAAEATGTYSAGEVTEMGILAATGKTFELRYDATKESGILIHIYKWNPSPAQNVTMNAGNEHTALALTGACLADDTKAVDSELGQFGRIYRV